MATLIAVGSVMNDFQPADVPVFNCVVYLAIRSDGTVRARVANLPGLKFDAKSEREAMSHLVPAFKLRLAELLNNRIPIPWIEPPLQIEPNEQIRLVAVHL